MSAADNVDLRLILRNTERASRAAQAAFDATERLVVSVGNRFDALESRMTAVESRMASLESRIGCVEKGMDGIARSNHRLEQMLSDILAKLVP